MNLVADLLRQGRLEADVRATAAEAFGLDGATGLRLRDRAAHAVPRQHQLLTLIRRHRGRATIAAWTRKPGTGAALRANG